MDSNRVTVRYARALVELAIEKNLTSIIYNDILLVYTSLTEYEHFNDYVINPSHGTEQKLEVLNNMYQNEVNELTIRFLKLVFEKKREFYLKDICRNIIELVRQHNNILIAHLEMSIKPNAELLEKIKISFESKLKKQIEMSTSINPTLIGGFVFTIDGIQYDASIANRLIMLKKELQHNN